MTTVYPSSAQAQTQQPQQSQGQPRDAQPRDVQLVNAVATQIRERVRTDPAFTADLVARPRDLGSGGGPSRGRQRSNRTCWSPPARNGGDCSTTEVLDFYRVHHHRQLLPEHLGLLLLRLLLTFAAATTEAAPLLTAGPPLLRVPREITAIKT